jgi:hypothetical protein
MQSTDLRTKPIQQATTQVLKTELRPYNSYTYLLLERKLITRNWIQFASCLNFSLNYFRRLNIQNGPLQFLAFI